MSQNAEIARRAFAAVTDVDDDRVLVAFHQSGRSRELDIPMESRFAQIVTVQDGKIVRTESYASREAAIEAAGKDKGR